MGRVSACTKRWLFFFFNSERMADFIDLLATAVGNAQSRAEVAASRALIVSAADDSRRQIERDLLYLI